MSKRPIHSSTCRHSILPYHLDSAEGVTGLFRQSAPSCTSFTIYKASVFISAHYLYRMISTVFTYMDYWQLPQIKSQDFFLEEESFGLHTEKQQQQLCKLF